MKKKSRSRMRFTLLKHSTKDLLGSYKSKIPESAIAPVQKSPDLPLELSKKQRKKMKRLRRLRALFSIFSKPIGLLRKWVNGLSNMQLALAIVTSMTIIFFIIQMITRPTINASSTTVMELLDAWNKKIAVVAILTVGLMYRQFLIWVWSAYNKKLQGKIRQ